MYSNYEPTAQDHIVLNNWAHYCQLNELGDDHDSLVISLLRRIYNFDYYYNYSDDGRVWRTWSKCEEVIKQDIERVRLVEPELADTLTNHFNVTRKDALAVAYPWLADQYYSAYAILIKQYEYTHDDAVKYLGMAKWIRDLANRVYKSAGCGHVVWASDYQKANQLLRNVNDPLFFHTPERVLKPVTVPNDLLIELGALAGLLESKGPFTKLRNGHLIQSYQLEVQYVNGFTIYSVCDFYLMV